MCRVDRANQTERVTVVVADDVPDYRWLIRFTLMSGGPDKITIVGEAEDGHEALALLLRHHPDIVISDLRMPRLNGLELARRIKQERPETAVILVSAHTEEMHRRMAAVSGADAFINKQALAYNLVPLIQEVLSRRPSAFSLGHEGS